MSRKKQDLISRQKEKTRETVVFTIAIQ